VTGPLRIRVALARPTFTLDIDLELPGSGITVLFGPSGSGKTTLLRAVAGLEPRASGEVRVAGQTWLDSAAGVRLPVWRRSLGYVFQEASLFEHLDVRGNLAYGLRRAGAVAPGAGPADMVAGDGPAALQAAIELLGIGHLLGRGVDGLSGGERQRVAIARALATRPRLLLLDEPLAALDAARRHEILPWLERMRDELSLPMLYVTHSADEAARLADRMVALDTGRVRADGPAAEVFAAIDAPVVAGDDAGTLVHARLVERDPRWHLARAEFDGGSFWVRDAGQAVGARVRLRVLARDVSVQLDAPARTSVQNHLAAVVEAIADGPDSSQALLRLRCGPTALLARLTRRAVDALGLAPGVPVWALVKAVAVIG
jgi:molybdate transport system ATP-binding protein